MPKRAFTLMEMIIVVIIIGIFATLGIPAYQNAIEDSKARVCETNLRALKTALDIYAMDHDIMPGALGELPQGYINKAYAQVMQGPDIWKTKLANAILDWNERDLAYAAPNFLFILAQRNIAMITCPGISAGNQTREGTGTDEIQHPSYGLNPVLKFMNSTTYRQLSASTILIADCDAVELNISGASFSNPANRHKHVTVSGWQDYAVRINRAGNVTHY